MRYQSNEFLESLYKARKPTVTLRQFKEICGHPFFYLKKIMQDRRVPDFNIEGLGRFIVDYQSARGYRAHLKYSIKRAEMAAAAALDAAARRYSENRASRMRDEMEVADNFVKNYVPKLKRDKHVIKNRQGKYAKTNWKIGARIEIE